MLGRIRNKHGRFNNVIYVEQGKISPKNLKSVSKSARRIGNLLNFEVYSGDVPRLHCEITCFTSPHSHKGAFTPQLFASYFTSDFVSENYLYKE